MDALSFLLVKLTCKVIEIHSGASRFHGVEFLLRLELALWTEDGFALGLLTVFDCH